VIVWAAIAPHGGLVFDQPEAATRLYSNPFFPYVEERLRGLIDAGAPPG